MQIEQAVRYSEIILALAYMQQSIEYLRGLPQERYWGAIGLLLSLLLLLGVSPLWVEAGLLIVALRFLQRFQGPYNGGSDCMGILVLVCLFLSHLAPSAFWQELALGYLAFQLTFSYFQSGYIKIINADWRSGQALVDVFAISAYPVSEHVRRFAQQPQLLWLMSWAVMLFELLFPLAIIHTQALMLALGLAACFHMANACLFGLNRFVWVWLAAYPSLLWFQAHLLGS